MKSFVSFAAFSTLLFLVLTTFQEHSASAGMTLGCGGVLEDHPHALVLPGHTRVVIPETSDGPAATATFTFELGDPDSFHFITKPVSYLGLFGGVSNARLLCNRDPNNTCGYLVWDTPGQNYHQVLARLRTGGWVNFTLALDPKRSPLGELTFDRKFTLKCHQVNQ